MAHARCELALALWPKAAYSDGVVEARRVLQVCGCVTVACGCVVVAVWLWLCVALVVERL